IEPTSVIEQMAKHVGGPTGGRSIHGVDVSQRSAGDNLFHFLVMLAISMLMAHDRFGSVGFKFLLDLQPLSAGHRNWFFKGDELGTALHANFDKIQTQIW